MSLSHLVIGEMLGSLVEIFEGRSGSYSTKTKLRINQSWVLSTFLYGLECWRMTEHDLSRLASFHTDSLRKILRIFWPRKISNDVLLKQTKQENFHTLVTRRRRAITT